jgi:hypothetical protein
MRSVADRSPAVVDVDQLGDRPGGVGEPTSTRGAVDPRDRRRLERDERRDDEALEGLAATSPEALIACAPTCPRTARQRARDCEQIDRAARRDSHGNAT